MGERNNDRFKSSIGFTDMLFNLLVGFVFLFVIAFILINPPVKKSDAPKKAEFLIVLEWEPDSRDDVDLWVRDPNNVTVSYTNREGGLMNLEKDDLGATNDQWRKPDGTVVTIPLNREVITLRGIEAGRYQVAVHIYSRRNIVVTEADGTKTTSDPSNGTFSVTLIKINPYGERYKISQVYNRRGQVFTAFNFELDDQGNIIDIDERRNNIVYRAGSGPAQ